MAAIAHEARKLLRILENSHVVPRPKTPAPTFRSSPQRERREVSARRPALRRRKQVSIGAPAQHPLQILLIFLSTFGSSARMSRSPGIEGPGVTVPSIRWPELPLRAIPVVDPPAAPVDPVEFAVPKVLVPGAVGIFTELPAPLGSLAELFSPPTFAGPLGTPLTAAVPAPGAPAFGEPTALPLPTLGPLAAPAAEVPP